MLLQSNQSGLGVGTRSTRRASAAEVLSCRACCDVLAATAPGGAARTTAVKTAAAAPIDRTALICEPLSLAAGWGCPPHIRRSTDPHPRNAHFRGAGCSPSRPIIGATRPPGDTPVTRCMNSSRTHLGGPPAPEAVEQGTRRWSSSERSERSVETTLDPSPSVVEQRAQRAISRDHPRPVAVGGRAASAASDQSRPPSTRRRRWLRSERQRASASVSKPLGQPADTTSP